MTHYFLIVQFPVGHAPRTSGGARQPRWDGESGRRTQEQHHKGIRYLECLGYCSHKKIEECGILEDILLRMRSIVFICFPSGPKRRASHVDLRASGYVLKQQMWRNFLPNFLQSKLNYKNVIDFTYFIIVDLCFTKSIMIILIFVLWSWRTRWRRTRGRERRIDSYRYLFYLMTLLIF